MKFTGSGVTAFDKMQKYLKTRKTKTSTDTMRQLKQHKSDKPHNLANIKNKLPKSKHRFRFTKKTPKVTNDTTHDAWSSKIRRKIDSLNCDKSRIFPLGDITFTPDYILKLSYEGKQIIVHIDRNFTNSATEKYKSFMEKFKTAYYFILVVSDNDLRRWNTTNMGRRILFDEIWVGEDVTDMIKNIQKLSEQTTNKIMVCSKCYKKIEGIQKIKSHFSYQTKEDGSLLINSICRKCVEIPQPTITHIPKSTYKCIGCGSDFDTTIASQLYCDVCNDKLQS